MKNFRRSGNSNPVPAPAGGVLSGDGVLVGSLFGIAAASAAEGELVELACVGVFDLKKTAGQTWTVGARIYWDAAAKVATVTPASNTVIGLAVAPAASSSATGLVRLNGVDATPGTLDQLPGGGGEGDVLKIASGVPTWAPAFDDFDGDVEAAVSAKTEIAALVPIADPSTATAEDCATTLNAIIAALKA
ncbi:DUF2190 family protein [Ancylobacter oerskovii]|uniref:DUF2190 family protein n=1 Tax=Ancylobacter oerskovii TaxID=459519 RepID=A0ABW4Z4N0_9HYPH|nr:DUF2190 family protein [Ancylobacter oerskovii]MBS7545729.1 DUF2190 family protein [Ancylobacter oerskovii]